MSVNSDYVDKDIRDRLVLDGLRKKRDSMGYRIAWLEIEIMKRTGVFPLDDSDKRTKTSKEKAWLNSMIKNVYLNKIYEKTHQTIACSNNQTQATCERALGGGWVVSMTNSMT